MKASLALHLPPLKREVAFAKQMTEGFRRGLLKLQTFNRKFGRDFLEFQIFDRKSGI